jgi:hypothetical protein
MALRAISFNGSTLPPFYLSYLDLRAELRADFPPVNILIGAPFKLLLCFYRKSEATYLER